MNMERRFDDIFLGYTSERTGLESLIDRTACFSDDAFFSHDLCLLKLTLTACHRLAHITTDGARIGLCALTAGWQFLRVPCAAICLDIAQAANIAADTAAQFTLDGKTFYSLTERGLFLRSQFLGTSPGVYTEALQRIKCPRASHTIDRGKRNLKTLFIWNGNSCNTHN